jgi:hypothetical protein
MVNNKDKKYLGLRRDQDYRRAMFLTGLCFAFILSALWYSALTGDTGAVRNATNLTPGGVSSQPVAVR